MKTRLDPSVNWLYETEPSPNTGGRIIAQPRGKTLGGSSAINGMAYNRGQRLDFDGWAQRGNRGWGYADVLPYFRRGEHKLGDGDEVFRGREGRLVVTDGEWKHPLCDAFIEGALSLGIPRNDDYNGQQQVGVGYTQRTIHKRRRMSAARAFLNPARHRKNLRIITRAHATSVLFSDKRAVGVAYVKGGRHGAAKEVSANREVILCGGTINSPQLLQLSGVGDPGLLGELGITCRHRLPGVGENLRDHYQNRIAVRVKNVTTMNERSHGWRLGAEIAKYFAGGQSILASNPTLVFCFWHSDENVRSNDLQITFTPATYSEAEKTALDEFPGMTCTVWQQRPESVGYIRARSTDPFEPPVIQPNYLDAEEDCRTVVGGLKLGRRLLRTDALAPYYVEEVLPGEHIASDAALLESARQGGASVYHIMGTCRMGPSSDPGAVVDDELRVHGLEGLRVVDASIMPMMPSANLNATAIMIGDKASDLILGKKPLEPEILPDSGAKPAI
jgi:choline dehydrogenase